MPGVFDTARTLKNRGQTIDRASGFAGRQAAPRAQAPAVQSLPQAPSIRDIDASNAISRQQQADLAAKRRSKQSQARPSLADLDAQIMALEAQQAQEAPTATRQFGAGRRNF